MQWHHAPPPRRRRPPGSCRAGSPAPAPAPRTPYASGAQTAPPRAACRRRRTPAAAPPPAAEGERAGGGGAVGVAGRAGAATDGPQDGGRAGRRLHRRLAGSSAAAGAHRLQLGAAHIPARADGAKGSYEQCGGAEPKFGRRKGGSGAAWAPAGQEPKAPLQHLDGHWRCRGSGHSEHRQRRSPHAPPAPRSPPLAAMAAPPQLNVFPVGNYTFGSKPPKFEKDSNVSARMERLKEKWVGAGLPGMSIRAPCAAVWAHRRRHSAAQHCPPPSAAAHRRRPSSAAGMRARGCAAPWTRCWWCTSTATRTCWCCRWAAAVSCVAAACCAAPLFCSVVAGPLLDPVLTPAHLLPSLHRRWEPASSSCRAAACGLARTVRRRTILCRQLLFHPSQCLEEAAMPIAGAGAVMPPLGAPAADCHRCQHLLLQRRRG